MIPVTGLRRPVFIVFTSGLRGRSNKRITGSATVLGDQFLTRVSRNGSVLDA